MRRILVTGVNGQVGWELRKSLMTLGEVIPASREGGSGILKLDLTQPAMLRSVIRDLKPQWIVNAAAYTAVDQAEQEPDVAMAVNGIAPGIMAEEAKRLGAIVIHYSTDYVFDGLKGLPYVETDETNPLNEYGRSKLAGERAIQAVDGPHLILRTSWVYSLRGKNFLLTMLRLAREQEALNIVADQVGSPTWSQTIAQSTAQIMAQGRESVEKKSGLYHLTSVGETSWYGFAQRIFELTEGLETRSLKTVLPIESAFYPSSVKRPNDSRLNIGALMRSFELQMPEWDVALSVVLARC
jgi:dTDP-4-dehydrorhamnose reductase